MVKRMVVLTNEDAVLTEISLQNAALSADSSDADGADPFGVEELEAELSSGNGVDLKAVSKRAAQLAEKRVIERVLQKTRWNRKEAAEQLQISYKALLYKMKENGLTESR